ncbi:3427_t:CDS:2, partial [Funneliformis mosseae]
YKNFLSPLKKGELKAIRLRDMKKRGKGCSLGTKRFKSACKTPKSNAKGQQQYRNVEK